MSFGGDYWRDQAHSCPACAGLPVGFAWDIREASREQVSCMRDRGLLPQPFPAPDPED